MKIAKENALKEYGEGLTVTFMDVGEGDSTFITFPDGTTFLIDTAKADGTYLSRIKTQAGTQVDYLVITDLNADHIGNATELIKTVRFKNTLLPFVTYKEKYPIYFRLLDGLIKSGTLIEYIDNTLHYDFGGAKVYFLSPTASGLTGSAIDDFNLSDNPTEKERNNISPIIYLEYKGVKFILESDADSSQEKVALNKARYFADGIDISSLTNIDFLKVAHHGANDGSGEEFLSVIKPKTAIISVGATNEYSHPSASVMERLFAANESVKIYRTDVFGSIRINVSLDRKISVCTTKNL